MQRTSSLIETTIEGNNMSRTVSPEIKKATTKCKHDFSCLESGQCGDRPLCDSHSDGSGVLFLKTKEHLACPYRTSFGERRLCACPTHAAIVGKYGVTKSSD